VWSGRLLAYLWPRVIGRPEDPRYARLRVQWGKPSAVFFLTFFLGQGALAILLSLPLVITRMNTRTEFSSWEWIGLVLWLAALSGEWISDMQLRRFKASPGNKGRTCRSGLWKYSRHPNYFFEWVIWVALAVFAAGSPWGWTSVLCPALMLYFLTRVTGIPPAEDQALQSRGEDYRQYQRTTSAFIPWFPRKERS